VAEKFEALVALGVANSRLKDFYDLWLITRTFELRSAALVEAIQRTFERRETVLPSVVPVGLTDEFAEAWAAQWRAFLGRDRMAAAPDAFAVTVADLRLFLMPLVVGVKEDRIWPPSGPWSPLDPRQCFIGLLRPKPCKCPDRHAGGSTGQGQLPARHMLELDRLLSKVHRPAAAGCQVDGADRDLCGRAQGVRRGGAV